jgi:hypothetical protein
VSQGRLAEPNPQGQAVAVTAIEHGSVVITVASLAYEPFGSAAPVRTFITTIMGGPLRGESRESRSWSKMIRSHSDAVSRVSEIIASEHDSSSQPDKECSP